jgi:CelD/BcsL family acetyltransferase involved in cellulose biosynthesis
MEGVPILEVRNISKRFGGVRALDRVNFAVMPNEIHALLGENGAGKRSKAPQAAEGLKFCNDLFDIENALEDVDPKERYARRLLRSKPVLDAFLAWLEKTREECAKQSHLGKAVEYCLNHWKELNNFLLDGRL